MTVESNVVRLEYAGNDVAVEFAVTFKFELAADIKVYIWDGVANPALQGNGVDYTVSGAGNPAANSRKVTMATAPATGETLIILLDPALTQATDFKNQGDFYPERHEKAFDKLTRLVQVLDARADRALMRDLVTDHGDYDAGGRKVINLADGEDAADAATWGQTQQAISATAMYGVANAPETAHFTGDGATTGFVMTGITLANAAYYFVRLDGLVQRPGADYTVTPSTDTITFAVAPANGVSIDVTVLATVGTAIEDSQLRADLFEQADDAKGSALVGFLPSGTGAQGRTVLSKLREFVSVKDFGALGDGVSNDAAAIQTALNWVIANDKALYFPEGVYLISGGDAGLTNSRIEPTIGDGDSIVMFGAGPGKTIIKEKSGDTLAYGAFHMMLYFNVGASETVNNLIIRDMTFDKNGASNGAPPSLYTWEQSHIIGAATSLASGRIRYALFENIEMLDKVGGGIVLMQGNVDNAVIRNCHARNFSDLFGERGDFEFQAHVEKLDVQSCTGRYAQCEPDTAWPGIPLVAAFRDCVIDLLELTSYQDSADAVKAQTVIVENCVATGKLTVRNAKLLASRSTFTVGSGSDEFWSRTAPGSSVVDCKVVTKYDAGTNTHSPFYPRSETTLGGTYVDFVRCIFEPASGASGTTTGDAINNAAFYAGAQPFLVRCVDCSFSAFYERTLNAYANGIYEMIRCKIAGWSTNPAIGAVNVGGFSTLYGKVLLQDCDFSRATAAFKVYYNNSNALWELRWRGVHKYSEFAITWVASNPDLYTKFDGIFVADAAPAGLGIKGMRVRVSNPVEGAGEEYVCLSNAAAGSATWRITKQFGVKKNTTANRPTLTASDIGAIHLDTTLDADGKPIWWTGTAWVDATGAVV